jgi:hydrogenase maturation protease
MNKTLVLGYGNTLRSDDGVGVWIADRIAALHLPNVDVRRCHQLHLELVPDLIEYESVILVDASTTGESIAVRRCIPSPLRPSSTDHNVSPEVLQQLALELYDAPIDIHLYTVRGECFDFGSTFSPSVKDRAGRALSMIISRIQSFVDSPEQSQVERIDK